MAGPAAQLDEAKRFAEIVAILQKHHLVQGLTPEKVRDIFVDLGPTFVKFGQILSMRSDILPKEYCAALETLRTDVTPMPLTEVEDILTQAYARPWQEVFSDIGIRPLGSASIAQVHAATLTDGQRVVVKVQRPDLYDIMSRDVRLLKRAAALLKYTPLASALDFHAVLDEMWHTVQEELDFTIEANNIAEFKRLNDGVAYADCPATFPKWCTKNVLVMEYIAGHQIDDADGLRADGYDLNEIAVKLVHNYIRQITVYRFFHADPHPGNIRVQGGKIIWLDLGMMGRISPREAELYMGIIRTIYDQDVPALTQTLLALGQYDRAPDQQALTERIGIFLHKYESMPMADMDMGVLVDEFVQILNEYGVSVPASLTMLGRSLLVIQGMLTSVSPDANVIEIVAEYVKNTALSREHIEKKVKTIAQPSPALPRCRGCWGCRGRRWCFSPPPSLSRSRCLTADAGRCESIQKKNDHPVRGGHSFSISPRRRSASRNAVQPSTRSSYVVPKSSVYHGSAMPRCRPANDSSGRIFPSGSCGRMRRRLRALFSSIVSSQS